MTSDVTSDRTDDEGGFRLSRRAGSFLVATLAVLIVGGPLLIVGLRPANHWVIVGMVERMGLEGVGLDPEEGQVLPGGLLGTTEKSEVEVQLGTLFRIALAPDTRIVLPRAPGRWLRRGAAIRLERGLVRATTAKGGTRPSPVIAIVTEETKARTSGATFAVSRRDGATCVALYEGNLRAAGTTLRPGEETCFSREGRAPSSQPMSESEREKLRTLAAEGPLPLAP